MRRPKLAKTEKNTTFTGEVRDLASDGRGVVRHPSGRTFFIPGVWMGEQGDFRVITTKGNIGEGELVQLTEASAERITPQCPYANSGILSNDDSLKNDPGFTNENNQTNARQLACGGCAWQFVNYNAQLDAKFCRVKKAMARLGAEDKVLPVMASGLAWKYRNRAQLKTDGKNIGYMAARSNALVPVESCAVLTQKNNNTLSDLIKCLPKDDWKPKQKQSWVTLDIDETVDATNVSINKRLPFQQGNSDQNSRMKRWLRDKLSALDMTAIDGVITPADTVLELFCGSGNFTEVIAASGAAKVIAAEASQEAVRELENKKLENSALENVEVLTVDLFNEDALKALVKKAKMATVLVLDPPRDGVKFRETLVHRNTKFKNIFYVSCDLATFSRDIADFQTAGFCVDEVQPIDLFPQTPHIELMCVLSKSANKKQGK